MPGHPRTGCSQKLGIPHPEPFARSQSPVDPAHGEDADQPDDGAGDMIVWDSHPEWGTPHLGVYMGSGLFAEVRPGGIVQVSDIADAPAGYMSVMPPKAVETGPGYGQPVRNMQAPQPPAPPKSYDATPGGMVQPPKSAPAGPVKPPKPPKSSNPAPGGRLADGYV